MARELMNSLSIHFTSSLHLWLDLRDEESNSCSGLARRLLDVGGVKRNRGGVKIPPVVTACGGDASAPISMADTNRPNISDGIILINMLDGAVDA